MILIKSAAATRLALASLLAAIVSITIAHARIPLNPADQQLKPIPWPAPTSATQLWNGKDLTGWTPYFKDGATSPNFWSASDDTLHLVSKIPGYIRTSGSFSNFHMHVEWRWISQPPKGTLNSGIFIFQHPPDVVWPYSIQVQTKTSVSGDLIAQGGLLFAPADTNLTVKKIADSNEKPVGEWNATDIFCRANTVEIFINGFRQNFVDKLPTDSGQVALQMEGYPIDFRNVWLEPVNPSP